MMMNQADEWQEADGALSVDIEAEEYQEPSDEASGPYKLVRLAFDLLGMPKANIAEDLSEEKLQSIGNECKRGYDADIESRSDWLRQTDEAMKLATQVAETKSWPWPGAANIKYPAITTAAIQYNARAYPAIVQGANVVKGQVIGPDQDGSKRDRAERIGKHMSFQLLEEMAEWEEDTDKLLIQQPIVGCAFRKTWYDPLLGRNCSKLVSAKDLVFDHNAKSFETLRRKSMEVKLYRNEIIERQRSGQYLDIDLPLEDKGGELDSLNEFIEQHCWIDLDEDGYQEPYIVVLHKSSSKVVRVTARFEVDGIKTNAKGEIAQIEADEYFTKYGFLPNPDGGLYDIGLGTLLLPLNEAINGVFNRLLDAGTLANTGGGFIGRGLRMKGGPMRFTPGEYKPVDANGSAIRENIVNLEFPGPSPVLFQLLGLLIDATRDISSVKDVMTGENQGANTPATTTLALIDQGMKVFSAIYKRTHRALKAEFKKLFKLNKMYLQPEAYFRVMDGGAQRVTIEDYQADDTDVIPVSDPTVVSLAQKVARAQALMPLAGDPSMNGQEIKRRYLEAIEEPNIDELFNQQPPPDPMESLEGKQLLLDERRVVLEEQKFLLDVQTRQAQTDKTNADTMAVLAKIEEMGGQIQYYAHQVAQFSEMMDAHRQMLQQLSEAMNGPRGMGELANPADYQEVPTIPEGLSGAFEGPMGGGGMDNGEFGGVGPEELGGGLEVPNPGGLEQPGF